MLEEGNADGEKINAFLDAYISRHPNCFNNDIQRKKAGKEAFQQERRQEKTAESPRRAETGTSPPAPEKERAEKDEYTP